MDERPLVAVQHLPRAGGDGITGDFAHIAPLPDGRLLVLIGDVMGSGRVAGEAAAEAERIVTSAVGSVTEPGDVLSALAGWVDRSLTDVLVTAMSAVIDIHAGEVAVASAGHPPALIVRGGIVQILELDPDPPLGAGGPIANVTTTSAFPAGSALVLYTDGLVERRDAGFDTGLEQLRHALEAVQLPAEELAKHVIAAMGCTDGAGDDIAVVTVVRP